MPWLVHWLRVHSSPISRFCRDICIEKGSATKPALKSVNISTLQIRLLGWTVSVLCFYLNRSCVRNLWCWWEEVCRLQKREKLEIRNPEVRQSTNVLTGECALRLGSYGEVAKKDPFYSRGVQKCTWWLW